MGVQRQAAPIRTGPGGYTDGSYAPACRGGGPASHGLLEGTGAQVSTEALVLVETGTEARVRHSGPAPSATGRGVMRRVGDAPREWEVRMPKLSEEQTRRAMVLSAEEGQTDGQIADQLGVTRGAVTCALTAAGCTNRPRLQPKRGTPLTASERRTIADLHAQGQSAGEIAAALGMSPQRVSGVLGAVARFGVGSAQETHVRQAVAMEAPAAEEPEETTAAPVGESDPTSEPFALTAPAAEAPMAPTNLDSAVLRAKLESLSLLLASAKVRPDRNPMYAECLHRMAVGHLEHLGDDLGALDLQDEASQEVHDIAGYLALGLATGRVVDKRSAIAAVRMCARLQQLIGRALSSATTTGGAA